MLAPVYRHIETEALLLGLTPVGLAVVGAVGWVSIMFLHSALAQLGLLLASYAGLRVAGYGRPPGFWVHYILFQVQQAWCGQDYLAGARAKAPIFPYAPLSMMDGGSR
jgi:hypothetical protein